VWRTDGTVAGTRALGGIDFRTRDSQVQVRPLAVLQGSVLFLADNGSGSLGLWKSDGTRAGTVRFLETYANNLVSGGNSPFFTAQRSPPVRTSRAVRGASGDSRRPSRKK